MPTNRTRRKRTARHASLPLEVQIWLEHGDSETCERILHEKDPEAARRGAGIYFLILDYSDDHPFVGDGTITRADLRHMGYGAQIDAHIEAGRTLPDHWRKGPVDENQ